MTAEARGVELALLPMSRLPDLALEFARHLCRRVGGNSEVLITAYAVYAQCVEGLPCTDDLYAARPDDRAWFAARVGPPLPERLAALDRARARVDEAEWDVRLKHAATYRFDPLAAGYRVAAAEDYERAEARFCRDVMAGRVPAAAP